MIRIEVAISATVQKEVKHAVSTAVNNPAHGYTYHIGAFGERDITHAVPLSQNKHARRTIMTDIGEHDGR